MLIARTKTKVGMIADFWHQYLKNQLYGDTTSFGEAKAFANIQTCCLFIGHPRSGSTLIGALLDAHPEILIATELDALHFVELGTTRQRLYRALVQRAEAFIGRFDYQWEGYRFQVPNQYQGRATTLRVIGDKKAGATARRFRDDPQLLARFQETIGDPLKVIQVVRNPFDNISTRWRRGHFAALGRSLAPAIDEYFSLYASSMNVRESLGEDHFSIVYHEDLIDEPAKQVLALCRFLGVDADEGYLKACASLVKPNAHRARFSIDWPSDAIEAVEKHIARYPSLERYRYNDTALTGDAR